MDVTDTRFTVTDADVTIEGESKKHVDSLDIDIIQGEVPLVLFGGVYNFVVKRGLVGGKQINNKRVKVVTKNEPERGPIS
jgi:hypothetical protein